MRLRIPCLAAFLLVWSCATSERSRSTDRTSAGPTAAPGIMEQDAEVDACPDRHTEVDLAACDGLSGDYGRSVERPLEWGFAAMGGRRTTPFFGRLLCEDGTSAIATREGSLFSTQTSSSPPSRLRQGHGDEVGEDMIDVWKTSCGGETITLYSNIYRCGNHCPPKGFRFSSAAGQAAYQRALALEKEGDLEGALLATEEALSFDHEVVSFHRARVYYNIELNRGDGIIAAAEEAAQALPTNTDLLSYRVMALQNSERWAEANAAADSLLQLIEGTSDRNLSATLCRKSFILKVLGDLEESASFGERSCALGFKRCCPAEGDDDAR